MELIIEQTIIKKNALPPRMSMNSRPKYTKVAQNGKIFVIKEGVLFYQIIDTLLHMHNMNSCYSHGAYF